MCPSSADQSLSSLFSLISLQKESNWFRANLDGEVRPFSQRFTVAKLTPRACARSSRLSLSCLRTSLTDFGKSLYSEAIAASRPAVGSSLPWSRSPRRCLQRKMWHDHQAPTTPENITFTAVQSAGISNLSSRASFLENLEF